MDVVVTGSSGLVGTPLKKYLAAHGHRPIAMVRRPAKPGADEIQWDPASGKIDSKSLDGVDAVINLAGAGIGDKKWNDQRKQLLVDSRTVSTRLLAETIATASSPPSVFVSGSAVGYYGSQGAAELTEDSPAGTDFLAQLCIDWEAAAQPAVDAGVRTAFARTGIVLSRRGGALGKQLPLFKLGLGGQVGPGTQWLPWISIDDEVAALAWLLTNDVAGPVNLTAPKPVTNQEFTKALGATLGRPTFLPVPMFAPKLLFGSELVEALLLGSQNVLPGVLTSESYDFIHPTIDVAFADIVGRTREAA